MAKKLKRHPFTVVYIYAPELYREDYMKGKPIPQIKLGETTADYDDPQTTMEECMKRINQLATGFKEFMYLLQWFVFPYKKNTDNAVRKILTENIYHLTSSNKLSKVKTKKISNERVTSIGLDFAYNISMAQVNTAISTYKLKSKMEELINDRGVDPAFKKRLHKMIKELLTNLDDVVKESAQSMYELPIVELKKILLQMENEELEPQF